PPAPRGARSTRLDGRARVRIGGTDARQHEPAQVPRPERVRAGAIHARRKGHATHSHGRMAIMAPTTELTQDQKSWVVRVTHVLGSTSRGLNSSSSGKLSLSEVKVSFLEADAATEQARRERGRALILPREHGAWGLLLVPMVTGAGVAFRESQHVFPLILLLTAALALFWLRTPLESLLATSAMRAQTLEESYSLRSVIVLLAGVAAVALAFLLWAGRNAGLWPLGAAVAAAFIAQAVLKKLGRRTRMLSEMVGTIGP